MNAEVIPPSRGKAAPDRHAGHVACGLMARPGLDMTTPISVLAAVSVFPKDLRKLPRAWVEDRFTDLRYWNVLGRGGHLPMLEVPETFLAELPAGFADSPQ